jgi:hypothetical protein
MKIMKTHYNRTEAEKIELAESVIVYMNEIMDKDRKAVHTLVELRVPCNDALADHPTVQVTGNVVGLLGILNGLIGIKEDGMGYVAARFLDGHLLGFELTK